MVPARFVVFVFVFVFVAPLVFRAPSGPAAREARRPHFVRRRASKPARALRSLRRPPHRRCLWFWCVWPGPAAAHGRRSQALPPTVAAARPPLPPAPSTPAVPVVLVCLARPCRRHSPISHVIPLRLFQILNAPRWNCNVFSVCWNFFQSNYVRVFRGLLFTGNYDNRSGGDRSSTVAACENSPSNPAPDVEARQNSPCRAKIPKNGPFLGSRANFVSEVLLRGVCWANFVPVRSPRKHAGRVLSRRRC